MTLQAVWVHGQAVVPNVPYDEQGNPLAGYIGSGSSDGAEFRGLASAQAWFHFPIATPVIHNGVRIRLVKAFVLFRSDPSVLITEVHIWDGPRRIDAFSPLDGVTGVHDGSRLLADLVPNVTMWTVAATPEIFWGVCVSVRVHFNQEGSITFTTAGLDFDF
jgi:hypothetical protein